MSAFALLWHRDGASAERRELEPLLRAVAGRGPDGCDSLFEGAFALGHCHFWTTPEEVDERQPLRHPGARFELAFDGRLDNREWLQHWLDREGERLDRDASDAALVVAAYARWGAGCFARLLGPFAVVVSDRRRGRVLCARDALGGRDLVYHVGPRLLVAATEESAVLAHPELSSTLDDRSLAAFLAARAPAPDATFYRDVRRVPPGSLLEVASLGERLTTFRSVEPAVCGRVGDGELVERFGELLRESVRCRQRATTPPAVLMSGGLDSTSVAALAARGGRDGRPTLAVSWVFDQLPAADERPFIGEMVRSCGLEPIAIAGDDAWPLRPGTTWAGEPNQPAEDLYRVLHDRSYRVLTERGRRVLLTGMFGDHLFLGSEYWLLDLLRQRRFLEAGAGVMRQLRVDHLHGFRSVRGTRTAAARVIGAGGRGRSCPPWLTAEAAGLIAPARRPGPTREREARARLCGAEDGWGPLYANAERARAARFGIELRHPLRDLRLVELAAGLPAHLLYRPGWTKWILRRAMRGILPEPVRTRRWESSLAGLAVRGLADREQQRMRAVLDAKAATWPRFVRREWLDGRSPISGCGAESLVPWLCLSLELWLGRRAGDTTGSERCGGLGTTSEGVG